MVEPNDYSNYTYSDIPFLDCQPGLPIDEDCLGQILLNIFLPFPPSEGADKLSWLESERSKFVIKYHRFMIGCNIPKTVNIFVYITFLSFLHISCVQITRQAGSTAYLVCQCLNGKHMLFYLIVTFASVQAVSNFKPLLMD